MHTKDSLKTDKSQGADNLAAALDRPLHLTMFSDRRAQHSETEMASMRQLADRIARGEPGAASKEAMTHIKLGRFSGERTKPGNALRSNAAHEGVSGIEADYDAGEMSIDEAEELLQEANVAACLYTSPSHMQPGKGHRFRILCPCSEEKPPAERAQLVARVNGALGGVLASESFAQSQSFTFGAVDGQTVPEVRLVEGRFIDLCDDLEAGAIGKPRKPLPEPMPAVDLSDDTRRLEAAAGMLRKSAERLAVTVHGENRNDALAREACPMGGLFANSLMQPDDVLDAFLPALEANGYLAEFGGDRDATRIINIQLKHGARFPVDPLPDLSHLLDDAWTADQMAEIDRKSVEERMDRLADRMKMDDEQRALIGGRTVPYFTDVADLLNTAAPPREWHVDDWIPAKTVHMLGGPGGTGKSLLAIQLAVATACGLPWIGMDVLKPGPVLYYGAEDDQDEMHRRFADVCHAAGVKPEPGWIKLRAAVAEDTIFATLDRATGKVQPTAIMKRIEAEAAKVRPSLLILDTLANLHALDPNSQEQARAFVSLLIGIAQRCGCTVLLLAHPSRTGIADGSGDGFSVAWSNSVRSRSYLTTDDKETDLRVLKGMKSNYGKMGQEVTLRWECGAFQTVTDSMVDRMSDRAVFLTVFDRLFGQRRYLSHKKGTNYAPALIADEEEARAAKLSKDRLRDALNALLKADVLTVEDYTTAHYKTAQRLARGPGIFAEGESDDPV